MREGVNDKIQSAGVSHLTFNYSSTDAAGQTQSTHSDHFTFSGSNYQPAPFEHQRACEQSSAAS